MWTKPTDIEDHQAKFLEEEFEIITAFKDDLLYVKGGKARLFTYFCTPLAYVDMRTNELVKEKTSVQWVETSKNHVMGTPSFPIEKFKAYHMKVRKSRAYTHEYTGREIPEGAHLLPVEIINDNVTDSRIEKLLSKYLEALYVEGLGQILMDKKSGMFKTKCSWPPTECILQIDPNKKIAKRSVATAEILVANSLEWDAKAKEYAAQKLTELASEWCQEEREVSVDEFKQRMKVAEIYISAGNITMYCDDGDLFLGHTITLEGTVQKGFTKAYIEG